MDTSSTRRLTMTKVIDILGVFIDFVKGYRNVFKNQKVSDRDGMKAKRDSTNDRKTKNAYYEDWEMSDGYPNPSDIYRELRGTRRLITRTSIYVSSLQDDDVLSEKGRKKLKEIVTLFIDFKRDIVNQISLLEPDLTERVNIQIKSLSQFGLVSTAADAAAPAADAAASAHADAPSSVDAAPAATVDDAPADPPTNVAPADAAADADEYVMFEEESTPSKFYISWEGSTGKRSKNSELIKHESDNGDRILTMRDHETHNDWSIVMSEGNYKQLEQLDKNVPTQIHVLKKYSTRRWYHFGGDQRKVHKNVDMTFKLL